jgi:hypothetical protein
MKDSKIIEIIILMNVLVAIKSYYYESFVVVLNNFIKSINLRLKQKYNPL